MSKKVLIVSSNYYSKISDNLENGAINLLKENKFNYELLNAPGCFEIPYLIKKNINNYVGFIALGCVIKGQTPHFDLICKSTFNAILSLSINFNK